MELGSRQEGDESFLFGRNLSGTLEKLNKSVKNLVRYVAEHEKNVFLIFASTTTIYTSLWRDMAYRTRCCDTDEAIFQVWWLKHIHRMNHSDLQY